MSTPGIELLDKRRKALLAEVADIEKMIESLISAHHNIRVGDIVMDTHRHRLMKVTELSYQGLGRPLVARATIVMNDEKEGLRAPKRELWLGDDWVQHAPHRNTEPVAMGGSAAWASVRLYDVFETTGGGIEKKTLKDQKLADLFPTDDLDNHPCEKDIAERGSHFIGGRVIKRALSQTRS